MLYHLKLIFRIYQKWSQKFTLIVSFVEAHLLQYIAVTNIELLMTITLNEPKRNNVFHIQYLYLSNVK